MELKGKKVLVTGSEGFIGSHLTEYLVSQGCDVRALVLYNSFNSWGWLDSLDERTKKSIEVIMGDIRDPRQMHDVVKSRDVVFHLAALIAIPYSYQAPHSYIDTNVKGTLNVAQAALENGVSRFIHTSTSEVYGTAITVPISESHPLQGQSPYSASKTGADQIAMSYHHSFNLPLTTLRPFNVFGPRQSNRAVIPTIISQILAGQKTLKLGAIHPTRDFTYVTDTVRGFFEVARAEKTVGMTMNLGSEFEISIGDLAHKIASTMGTKISIESEDARKRPQGSEVERLLCDATLIKKHTDWRPQYSGLEGFDRGLKLTLDWFSKPENQKLYKSSMYVV